MLLFRCDYAEGAHPEILKRLTETNFEQLDGYGNDPYTQSAKRKILEACHCPEGEVHLLVGGTQTNSTIIAAMLADYEGAVAVQTGHIAVHEAGAVEYTGHKVLTLPQHHGKMDAGELEAFLAASAADPNKDHMVWPGLVYISLSTEYGTIYTRAELTELQSIAHKYGLPLFIDCDGDTLLIQVDPAGPTCHRGTTACFDTPEDEGFIRSLSKLIQGRHAQMPDGSYTTKLYIKGPKAIAKKVGEEATEMIIEAVDGNRDRFIYETSDLAYHLLVLLESMGCTVEDIERELALRHR